MLEVRGITKLFPGVRALSDVSCTFNNGQIHALLGENGAGKSTLMKIICGVYQPDEGDIAIDGKAVRFHSFHDAMRQGISIVNQEIQVIPFASIAENIMLDKIGQYRSRMGLDWKRLNADASRYLEMMGLNLSPKTSAGGLSPAQKQMIQIARALSANASYLLLDEPTSSLTDNEARLLFTLLRQLRDKGIALIFISHKLEEVLELCDHLTVLRDGKFIGTRSCEGISKSDIIEMMIGRKGNDEYLGKLDVDYTTPALSVRNLCQHGRFDGIGFDAYPGEILGFYGLVGSGRTELARAVIGDSRVEKMDVKIHGKSETITSIPDTVNRLGIGYVSENRKEDGLILDFDVTQNTTITVWNRLKKGKHGPIDIREEKRRTQDIVDKLEVKTPSLSQKVINLSGGNQQKVSIGKWLTRECDILFIDEPTVGVDVGAKEYIHKLIWNLAKNEHKTIILISSDMPEMIKLARRILIFRENRIVAEINDLNAEPPGRSYAYVSSEIGKYLV